MITPNGHVPIHPSYLRFIDKFPFTTNNRAGDNSSSADG